MQWHAFWDTVWSVTVPRTKWHVVWFSWNSWIIYVHSHGRHFRTYVHRPFGLCVQSIISWCAHCWLYNILRRYVCGRMLSVAGQTSTEMDGTRIHQLSTFYISQRRLDVWFVFYIVRFINAQKLTWTGRLFVIIYELFIWAGDSRQRICFRWRMLRCLFLCCDQS